MSASAAASVPGPPARATGPRAWLRYANLRWRLLERLARAAGALARRFLPVFQRGNTAYVLRFADVRSVLARPEDFSVAIFGMRMGETIGSFFLGMNPSRQYAREAGAMRRALGVPDPRRPAEGGLGPEELGRLSEVRRLGAARSRARVEEALKAKGEIDVVSDLANPVPLEFARTFFGIPEPDPGHPQLRHWLEIASYYVFAPSAPDWAVPAQRAGRQLAAHVRRVVAERHAEIAAGHQTPDDVLGRLIAAQGGAGGIDDDAIARSLAGTLSGTIIPTSWLFLEAVDRLMSLGAWHRDRLHQLAVEGDAAAVRAYVIEAARFFPFPFFILRYAERDATIAAQKIRKGTIVNLVIGSATTDSQAIRRAGRFVPDRPESEYMLFGHETHFCQGKDIAEELMTQMALALFSRENLRRAPGLRGYIATGSRGVIPDGSYPSSLILKADG